MPLRRGGWVVGERGAVLSNGERLDSGVSFMVGEHGLFTTSGQCQDINRVSASSEPSQSKIAKGGNH